MRHFIHTDNETNKKVNLFGFESFWFNKTREGRAGGSGVPMAFFALILVTTDGGSNYKVKNPIRLESREN